tara:strand:- start:373 stop:501 length:129 start_codon:yes stop_codon:yes gene_type:complete
MENCMYTPTDKVLDGIAAVGLVASFILLYVCASIVDLSIVGM